MKRLRGLPRSRRVAGAGIERRDLQVMSLPSYHCSTPHHHLRHEAGGVNPTQDFSARRYFASPAAIATAASAGGGTFAASNVSFFSPSTSTTRTVIVSWPWNE